MLDKVRNSELSKLNLKGNKLGGELTEARRKNSPGDISTSEVPGGTTGKDTDLTDEN